MYGAMCSSVYLTGVISTFKKMQELDVDVYFVNTTTESLITRARNEIARAFMESECSHLMFIDADISFEGDDVARLLEADCDIVCGAYPKKEIDWVRIDEAAKKGKENLSDYGGAFVLNLPDNGNQTFMQNNIVEIRHGGTGFMLIKRNVFEKLADKVPVYRRSTIKENGQYVYPETKEYFATSIDNTGALLSEDFYFCELWRKYGGKIYADLSIKLEHFGPYLFGGSISVAGLNIK